MRHHARSDEDLPVLLPENVNFEKAGNPLENHPSWKFTKCPSCERDALRRPTLLTRSLSPHGTLIGFVMLKGKLLLTKSLLTILVASRPIYRWCGARRFAFAIFAIFHSRTS